MKCNENNEAEKFFHGGLKWPEVERQYLTNENGENTLSGDVNIEIIEIYLFENQSNIKIPIIINIKSIINIIILLFVRMREKKPLHYGDYILYVNQEEI